MIALLLDEQQSILTGTQSSSGTDGKNSR